MRFGVANLFAPVIHMLGVGVRIVSPTEEHHACRDDVKALKRFKGLLFSR
jgi:hypothetical protein